MNDILATFAILLIIDGVRTKAQIFCREDFSIEQSIEISCSGLKLNDENYWATLNTSFFEAQVALRANNSLDERFVTFQVENNYIQTLKILPYMPTVVTLSFRKNRLVSGEDGTFQNLPHIKSLDLSHNRFSGKNITKNFFRGKHNGQLFLENLNLAFNLIAKLQAGSFWYLNNLITLDLSHNPLATIEQETMIAITGLPKLQYLNLAQTKLSYISDAFFAKLSLQWLYINNNYFTEIPKSLRKLGNTLKYLNLNANPINKIDSNSFNELSNLHELHISGMYDLISIQKDSFSQLLSLNILHCSSNPLLNFIHAEAFNGLKQQWNLKEIFLNDNSLTFLAEETFDLKKLAFLSLHGNPWNCSCSMQWLYRYVKKRELIDPEANIGIRCKYPEKLNRRSFLNVEKMLRCNETIHVVNQHSTRLSLFILIIVLMTIFLILPLILYFCFLMFRKNFESFRKQLSRPISSRISPVSKYKRVELLDNVEMVDNIN